MRNDLVDESRRSFLGRLARTSLLPAALLAVPDAPEVTSSSRTPVHGLPVHPFGVAGFRYHDGPRILPGLREGMRLTLRPEPGNPHDSGAVEILRDDAKLGYVPRCFNRHVGRLLAEGAELRCEVARLDTTAPPWDAVAVRVALPTPADRGDSALTT